jgi:CheY-like chemotaxis protein
MREKESGRRQHTRIIGLTASPLRDDQLLAKAAGMDDVWVKPIDEVALRSAFN